MSNNEFTHKCYAELVIGKDEDGDDIYDELCIELGGSGVESYGDGWNEPREAAHAEDIGVIAVWKDDGTVVEKNDPIWQIAVQWSKTEAADDKMADAWENELQDRRDSYYER